MEAVRNKNYKEMDKNTKPKSQKEGEQKEGTNQQYNKQRDQEQNQYQQEDQWQTQKKRNNNQLLAPRCNPRQAEQATNQAGITNIPTQNTYINLDVQESSHSLEVLDNYKGTKGDSRPHTAATNQKGQDEYNRKIANAGKDTTKKLQVDIISKQVKEISKGKEVYTGQAGTGIYSMLPSPNPIDNVDNIIAEVAVGGLDGKEHETHTELQEWVSKRTGGELTPLRHEEVEFDHSGDSRAPATPFNNQQKITNAQVTDTGQQQGIFNNESGDRLSKKKREVIKKRLQQSMGTDTAGIDTGQQTDAEQVIHTNRVKVPPDDYGALNSEDDLDPDNQSLEESDENPEDTMKHTGQVVGSSF
ncbi:hypothetical protein KY289_008166 [Solanum tuberosum]|nr:hypothetical protein KY289_008166 [Solanum tuberosum]